MHGPNGMLMAFVDDHGHRDRVRVHLERPRVVHLAGLSYAGICVWKSSKAPRRALAKVHNWRFRIKHRDARAKWQVDGLR